MYSNQNSKNSDLKEYAKRLSKKVANLPPSTSHKMETEDFQNFDFTQILKDLEEFLNSDLMNFENYEHWLEDDIGPDQTR